MELSNNLPQSQQISQIQQELSLKRTQLASIDQKEQIQSSFAKNDTIEISDKNYDENDYQRVLEKFRSTDSQIRTHEQAHASSGVATTTPISYNYQSGPDGKLYATGGFVRLDTSIPDDPKSASHKLEQLKNSASAPSDLSSADTQIARTANLNKLFLQYHSQEEFN